MTYVNAYFECFDALKPEAVSYGHSLAVTDPFGFLFISTNDLQSSDSTRMNSESKTPKSRVYIENVLTILVDISEGNVLVDPGNQTQPTNVLDLAKYNDEDCNSERPLGDACTLYVKQAATRKESIASKTCLHNTCPDLCPT